MYDDLHPRCQTPEFSSFIQLLASCTELFDLSFVILDALDECGEAQRPEILSVISQLVTPKSQFKLLATSRHHPQISKVYLNRHQESILLPMIRMSLFSWK